MSADFGNGRAPHTLAHDEMRREGLPELERWMAEALEDRNPPFDCDLVAATDVENNLPERMRRMNGLHKIIPAFLRDEAGATLLGPHRIPGVTSTKRLWAIRRAELYAQMTPKARVERYLRAGLGGSAATDFDDVMPEDLPDPLA